MEIVSVRSNSVNLIRDSSVKKNFSLDLLVSNRLTGTTAKILSFNVVNSGQNIISQRIFVTSVFHNDICPMDTNIEFRKYFQLVGDHFRK